MRCPKLLVILGCFVVSFVVFSSAAMGITRTIGTGTGFVVSSDGFILTNEHVIHGASQIAVSLGDNEYLATLVRSDPGNDMALLKITAQNLPFIPLGDSARARVGDSVYTVGCPQGICGTGTAGRVANLDVRSRATSTGYIMMDLTVTYGSSGGPLLNDRGEVIGITSAVLTGGAGKGQTGFSFAVPIDVVAPFLQGASGFPAGSLATKGTATVALSMSDILERVGPAVAYVENRKEIALSSLVPSPGSEWSFGDAYVWSGRGDSRIARLRALLSTEQMELLVSAGFEELSTLVKDLLGQMSAMELCRLLGYPDMLAYSLAYIAVGPFSGPGLGLPLFDLRPYPSSRDYTAEAWESALRAYNGRMANVMQSGLPISYGAARPTTRLGSVGTPYAQLVTSRAASGGTLYAVFLTALFENSDQATAMRDTLLDQDIGAGTSKALEGTLSAGGTEIPYAVGFWVDGAATTGTTRAVAAFTVDEVLLTVLAYWTSSDSSATFRVANNCLSASYANKPSSSICPLVELADLLNLQLGAVAAAFGE